MRSSLAYEELEISPYKLISLLELNIEKKINEHGKLILKGIIQDEDKDSYINRINTQITVQDKEAGKIIFLGKVIELKINLIHEVNYIELVAVSNTYELDIELKKRSFQSTDSDSIVKKIVSEYGGDFISSLKGLKVPILLQYNETDFGFIARIASKNGLGIVADSTNEKSRFWIGIPEGKNLGEIDKFTYSVCKEIDRYKDVSQNSSGGQAEKDFFYYEIETGEVFNIGDKVKFRGETLFICEVNSKFINGVLKSRYKLSPKSGLTRKPIYNKNIIGLSLEGKVTAVSGDKLKVHLQIDDSQGSFMYSYSSPYTAEGSGGWFCMPEVGDTVYVHFPDDREENAFSTLSLRKDGGGLGDPSTKYFKTKSGKELIFSPSEIIITTGSTFIKISDGSGIQIVSPSNINISAGGNVNVNASSKLIVSADGKLQISGGGSSIKMDGNITMSGGDVRIN